MNLKISVTVCLFLLTFLCSYVPWIIRIRFKASNTVMSYLNCAAGGVVLGALMMHMLPHVIEEEEQSSKKAYPYGALSAGVAFLLLFAIDRLFLCHSQQMVGKNTGKVCHDNDMLGGCHIDGIPASSSKTQAFIFVLALSVHSFFEGLGMATQDKETDLISYIISLFAHKWLEAFALGVSIMNAKFKKLAIFSLILIYSLLTPLGIYYY